MTSAELHELRLRIDAARREKLRASRNLRYECAGCGGELENYTKGCRTCWGRLQNRKRRKAPHECAGCGTEIENYTRGCRTCDARRNMRNRREQETANG